MAEKREDADNVMAFDALYTNNQIQKLKVLLPYIEPSMQRHMAVYIKYMELQYTMNLTKRHTATLYGCGLPTSEKPDLQKLCRELSLYSTPEEIRQLEQIRNVLQTMETVQEMTRTMNAMKEIFPDMNMESAGSPTMDMLLQMLTPEQREMYQMFQQQPFPNGNDN
ncbi:MAG: hypothetical protein NC302_00640 [Bacteroidales bacterium]|nr:hypothetical protein [Bacteroidales bacterium]MCM1414403.1 hypothetical protein [bacterium]MCM1422283.1 hypothetical protein [bacterium]